MSRASDLARDAALRTLAAALHRRSTRSGACAGVALMYHDVAPETGDPGSMFAPPLGVDALREQLLLLRSRYDVVSVHELRERIRARRTGDRFAVALTFDDDVESHATLAAPLLSELGMPATFFLTGSSLDGPAAFWWHDVQELYSRGGEDWAAVRAEAEKRWGRVGDELDTEMLARTIENLPPDDRDSLAARLRELVGAPTDRGLPEAAVRRLVGEGFDIGFHTRWHYLTQSLDDERLHRAFREGVDRLAAVVGRPLTTIAYPHCRPGDFRIAGAAAEAGFELGFLCNERALARNSHPLLMERISGWQPSLARFAWRLTREIAQVR